MLALVIVDFLSLEPKLFRQSDAREKLMVTKIIYI